MRWHAALEVPRGAHRAELRVRSYDVGRGGAPGVGTLLRYLEAVATEASTAVGFDPRWYERHNSAFVVRRMDLLIGAPPAIGDELLLATWVAEARRVQAQREYAIWRRDDGRLVARASGRWAYVDRARGQPTRLDAAMIGTFPLLGGAMPPRRLPEPEDGDAPPARGALALTAREYEMDSQGHVNNCVYADWLSEGLHRALRAEGAAGAAPPPPRPRCLRIEYVRPAMAGDEVRVATAAYPRGDRGWDVRQEIARAGDGEAVVRARARYLRPPAH